MITRSGWSKLAGGWISALAFLVLAPVLLVHAFQSLQAEDSGTVSATYVHGKLNITIPYPAGAAGAGELTIDVLDPEDRAVGRTEQRVETTGAKGSWHLDVALTESLALDDLVWHRVHYRFSSDSRKETSFEGTDSLSQILRIPMLRILGQQSYLSGGAAAVRVIVTDSKNHPITGPSSLQIALLASNREPRILFHGPLNRRGTTEAQFRVPAGVAGQQSLRYFVDTPIGSTEFTQPVHIEDKVSILLTTEKPIYQPGQTIHVRALTLDRANHAAAAGRKLLFEVEDSRGNKVFRKATQTDKFGVAAAEFNLAEEVNLGTYHLRAVMDDPGGSSKNNAEVALNVERYVLPKFKVAIDFTGGPDAKTKHGYRPGDHVIGTVRANYFFGKPVADGAVTVKASTMDVSVNEVGSVEGKTDAEGAYHFDLRLPSYFAGRPLSQGAARVLIEASVKDSAAHAETRGMPITVSESPLLITALPEGGKLIPNLDNQIFLLTSYPDGTPATAEVRVRAAGADQTVKTDAGGIAVLQLKPGAGNESLRVEAIDSQGNRVTTTVPLESRGGVDQILLRSERAVYATGDRIFLHVLTTKKTGSAYLDIVKDGQTIVTRDFDLVNGQGELTLAATPQLAGTLDVNAYIFGQDARPVADHRLIFVQPADELKVDAASDASVYKPGEDARIRFHVTNARGEGVQAALGVQVVDEAVFALAEKQPGFAKVFFYLEQEAMKPRYEIHSIGMAEIVEPVEKARAEQRNRAARALFAATEMVNPNRFETELSRSVPQTKFTEYANRYRTQFSQTVSEALGQAYARNPDLTRVQVHDPWATSLRIEPAAWNPKQAYLVRSAGPDKQFDTADDLQMIAQIRQGRVFNPNASGTLSLSIEHERGPFNGLAEVAGSVVDPTGAAISEASVTARETATGNVRTSRSNPSGQFSLPGLHPGDYEVRVTAPGFQSVLRKFALAVRDRAILNATLVVGSAAENVIVTGVPARQRFGGNVLFEAEAVRQGVVGGIAGAHALQLAAPAPPPAPMAAVLVDKVSINSATVLKKEPAAEPRVRSYFPEALYINPEVITDGTGRASITIPLADSITTWRMALVASTVNGALGSGSSSLKVFQDFFVDLDLPVTLTEGDRVSIPVAAYNYSGARGNVDLKLQASDWYSLVNDVPEKSVAVDSGRVGGAQFTLQANHIGKFKFTLSARMNGPAGRADIVVREIEVVPNGREQNQVFNGRLETSVQHDLKFPNAAIPDATKLFVRLYPGPLSQVVEGMDALLRMPFGCFEQTSSATYPNVLALDYMKRINKLTPEVHAKAEGFIVNGYQRLLTFEVPGGGFSWFGQAPANKILTSYGLMEFSDMSKVHEIDAKVIQRTQQWLVSQQQADGSWKPDTSFINEGATNRYNSDALRIAAYIGWALENTGYHGPAIEKARQFVENRMADKSAGLDSYTLAVIANFAAEYGKDREFTHQAVTQLLDARIEKDEQVWWTSQETGVFATGASASVETTGLAIQALLKSGNSSTIASKALRYIAAKKDASGTWGTTQATIMALRALLLSTEKGAADVQGTVEISLNGRTVQTLQLTPENNDLFHQFVFPRIDAKQAQTVALRFTGKGGLAYQVVGQYFVPWTEKPANEPLSIDVTYDRTHLAQDDLATATAKVKNNLNKTANMVMVDLGIPPGFDLLSEDLQDYQNRSAALKSGRLQKFSLTATQAILYFDSLAPGETVTVKFRLRAKYPIRAHTFQSRVYEYYDPDVNAIARPVQLEVTKR